MTENLSDELNVEQRKEIFNLNFTDIKNKIAVAAPMPFEEPVIKTVFAIFYLIKILYNDYNTKNIFFQIIFFEIE